MTRRRKKNLDFDELGHKVASRDVLHNEIEVEGVLE